MKFRVGQEVTITDRFATSDEFADYVIEFGGEELDSFKLMTDHMIEWFSGRTAKIVYKNLLDDGSCSYRIDIDHGVYSWTKYMFEEHYNKLLCVDMTGAEALI